MALYNWNGDEKKDMTDDFIEYQIYKDHTGNGSTLRNAVNSLSAGSFWIVFIIAMIVGAFNEIFGVLILLGYGWLKSMDM